MAESDSISRWDLSVRLLRIALFLVLIAVPAYGRFSMSTGELKRVERFEKKSLQTFESLQAGSWVDFPNRFEALWNEHFGHRIWLAKMFAKVRWHVFGVTPSDRFVVGKEGFFFQISARERSDAGEEVSLHSMLDAHLGFDPFSKASLEEWERAVIARKNYLEAKGFEYLFTVAPDKASIYDDKLPVSFAVKGPGRAEELLSYLEAKGLPAINLVHYLKEQRKELKYPVFLKTDGHWNKLGAFVAYQAMMKKARYGSHKTFDDYLIREDKNWFHQGFSSQIGFPLIEPFYRLKQKEKSPVTWHTRYTPLLIEQFLPAVANRIEVRKKRSKAVVKIEGISQLRMSVLFNPEATDYDMIIVYGDSFAAKMIWFFAEHTRVLLHVKTTNTFPVEPLELLQAAGPERKVLFVQELAEKYLVNRRPEFPR